MLKYENEMSNKIFDNLRKELLSRFGKDLLEETAFPVYYSKFPFVSRICWKRLDIVKNSLKYEMGDSALDFGSGLGVSLPFLREKYKKVVACDIRHEVTKFMIDRLGLSHVDLTNSIPEDGNFDLILALDVLEHVNNLDEVLNKFYAITANNGVWIICSPTENFWYRIGRFLARTSGIGHVRDVYNILDKVPKNMICEEVHRLPYFTPLFVISKFRKCQ